MDHVGRAASYLSIQYFGTKARGGKSWKGKEEGTGRNDGMGRIARSCSLPPIETFLIMPQHQQRERKETKEEEERRRGREGEDAAAFQEGAKVLVTACFFCSSPF